MKLWSQDYALQFDQCAGSLFLLAKHLRFYFAYFSQNIRLILTLIFILFAYQAYILRYIFREADF